MSLTRLPLLLVVLGLSHHAFAIEILPLNQQAKTKAQLLADLGQQASHASIAEVKVAGADPTMRLQTLCADGEGRVLALVAPPRSFAATAKGATGEVHVFTQDGKPVSHWAVPFHAHSINVGPDGHVYVAGDGRVARFDKAGKAVGEPVELPHIASLLKDEAGLRKRAEDQVKKQAAARERTSVQIAKQYEDRIKAIEAKKEADRTKTEVRQLEQLKGLLQSLKDQAAAQPRPLNVEQIMKGMTGRMRVINGIAVSERDVFVACGEVEGYGYAVWRLDRDLANPVKVISDLRGCCLQIDIQCAGTDILVAENTKHQFGRYDRDGKPLAAYGKKAVGADPAGFVGCCNPMNVRASNAGGDVLTAESEGIIKRFSATGEFRGVVGAVTLEAGCKNVAIGMSPDGDRVYFCDQPGSKFFVLARKSAEKKN